MEQQPKKFEPALLPVRLEPHVQLQVAVPEGDVPPLTADEVEKTREVVRRERATPV
jgi:hypothetical protein